MSRPDRISLTGRGEVARRPLVLDSAMVLTREGDGWRIDADAAALRRRPRHAVGPHRVQSRAACRFAGHAAAIARHRLAEPGDERQRQRPARLSLARRQWPAERPRRLAHPRAQPRRAGAVVQADRRRPRRGAVAAARRRCARSRSATARPSAAPRRASRRSAHGPIVAALMQCADGAAASLCRAGGHLVAAVRASRCSTSPARWRSAPTSAAGWSIRSSAAR